MDLLLIVLLVLVILAVAGGIAFAPWMWILAAVLLIAALGYWGRSRRL